MLIIYLQVLEMVRAAEQALLVLWRLSERLYATVCVQ